MNVEKFKPLLYCGGRFPAPIKGGSSSDHVVLLHCFENPLYITYAYHAALSFFRYTDLRHCDFRVVTSSDWVGDIVRDMFPLVPVMRSSYMDKYSLIPLFKDKRRVTVLDADLFASGVSNDTFFRDIEKNEFILFCESNKDSFTEIKDRIERWETEFNDVESLQDVLRKYGADPLFRKDHIWYQAGLVSIPIQDTSGLLWNMIEDLSGKWHSDETIYNIYALSAASTVKLAVDKWPTYYPDCSGSGLSDWNPDGREFQIAHPISGDGVHKDARKLMDHFRRLSKEYDH